MKTLTSVAALVAVLLTASLVTPSAAMTAEELVAKHIEATGGEEKLKSINTTKMTGKMMAMGAELPITVVVKRPNMMRVDVEFQGTPIEQAFSGDTGWMVNPMMGTKEPQDMPPLQELGMKYQADIEGPFIDYKKKGYTIELVGDDEVEGTPVHHLRLDTGGGLELDCYFDTEYYLLIKQTGTLTLDEVTFAQDTYFSDFEEVGGILQPHSIETRSEQGGQSITVETIEYNMEIDDAIFARPTSEE